MASSPSQSANIHVRPCHYRDLDGIESLAKPSSNGFETESRGYTPPGVAEDFQNLRRWYGPLKLLSLFPNPLRHFFIAYIAECEGKIQGMIQVAPFNRTRSTWRIERITAESDFSPHSESLSSEEAPGPRANGKSRSRVGLISTDIASHLLRYCLDTIWEARTWLVEVGVNDQNGLGLYRQHGFQPLAQMTYWAIAPDLLSVLAEHEANLPNLRPANNSDAPLLHQLDTVSMPPLVRQVFDRHVSDFKSGLLRSSVDGLGRLVHHQEVISTYVFEPQRKAAIGYFRLHVSQGGHEPHHAHLTVHPAYTWLYPEMLAYMARLLKNYPVQALQIASSDYQPEREEYLEKIGADRTEHTLMMSRSVWHKIRETKPVSIEGLQLSEVLQGLQPSRKPVPGRFSWIPPLRSAGPQSTEISPSSRDSQVRFQKPSNSPSSSPKSGGSSEGDRPSREDLNNSAHWPQDGAT